MSNTPLHIKYRPSAFEECLGQDVTVTILKNSITFNKIPKVIIFSGSHGTGKTSLARIFAKTLNCETKTQITECCNFCSLYKDISMSKAIDVLEVDGATTRGIASIKEIQETARYKSIYPYRVIIIDETHMLTKEAFNALLKLLEEPPDRFIVILCTTDLYSIPDTVKSRSQLFNLNPITTIIVYEHLSRIVESEKIEIEEISLKLLARYSKGSLRDALVILEQLSCLGKKIQKSDLDAVYGSIEQTHIKNLFKYIASKNLKEILNTIDVIIAAGSKCETLFTVFIEVLRDFAIILSKSNAEFFIDESEYSEIYKDFQFAKLSKWIDFLIARLNMVKTNNSLSRCITEFAFLQLVVI